MEKISIVTGASGGIGQVFVRELTKEALDEIWVVGRNEQRLLALKNEFGGRITPICKDLTKNADLLSFFSLCHISIYMLPQKPLNAAIHVL